MELAIKPKKNKEDQDVRDTVPKEYHHLLDVFEKGEKTTLPPHRPGVDLRIELEEGKTVPIKKIYPLSYDQIEELHQYIKQNEHRGWIRKVKPEGPHRLCLSRKKTANSDYASTTESSTRSP